MQGVRAAVSDPYPSFLECVHDAKDRIQLYMGHLHRAVKQQRRIGDVMDGICGGEESKFVLVTNDYKMKFDPIRYRETIKVRNFMPSWTFLGIEVWHSTREGNANKRPVGILHQMVTAT